MYQRYLKILDAVDKSGLYVKDLTGPQKAKARATAETLSMGDQDVFETKYQQLLDRERRTLSTFNDTQLTAFHAEAEAKAKSERGYAQLNPPRQAQLIEDIYDDLVDRASAGAIQKLTLNAEGYKVALETLQEQFPYFIRRASYEPLRSTDSQKGFLEARGAGTLQGSKQRSFAQDQGYVRPGGIRPVSASEGFFAPTGPEVPLKEYRGGKPKADRPWMRSSESSENVSEKPVTSSDQSVGGIADQRAAGGANAGALPPAATPKSPIEAMLAQLAPGRQDKAAQYLSLVRGALDAIPAPPAQKGLEGISSWQQAKQLPTDDQKLRWLLDEGRGSLPEALNDPDGQTLLANKGAVKSAIVSLGGADLDDALAPNDDGTPSALQEYFGGPVRNAAEAGAVLGGMLQVVVQEKTSTTPFVDPATSTEDLLYYTGAKPQRLPGYVEQTNPDQFNASADIQQLLPLSAEIGTGPNGYLSESEVAQNVKTRIETLQKLKNQVRQLAQSDAVSRDPDSFSLDIIQRNLNLNPEQINMAMGSDVTSIDDLRPENIDAQALRLQRAWTSLATERAVHMLGDGLPKGLLLPRKVIPPEETTAKAFSSRRVVRMLDPSDPLALEVGIRKAAGLPFVPMRKRA
jgi:hypothetical protein